MKYFKYLFVILLFLINSNSYAKTFIEINVLTEHFFSSCQVAKNFSNKIGDCGNLINNTIVGINLSVNDNETARIFLGQNSANEPMAGYAASFSANKLGLNYGPMIGLYFQDREAFAKKNLTIIAIRAGPIDIIPVLGLDVSYQLKHFKIFSFVTPALMTLGFGVSF